MAHDCICGEVGQLYNRRAEEYVSWLLTFRFCRSTNNIDIISPINTIDPQFRELTFNQRMCFAWMTLQERLCVVRGKHVGLEPHWIWTQRGLFLGMLRCLGPRQKAHIKRSSLGGWKVGYQLQCRYSMGPTRLHLVNTFRPSLAQILKRPLTLQSTLNTSSSTFPLTFYHFLNQSILFHTKCIYLATILSFPPFPSAISRPFLICFTLLMKGRSRGVFCIDYVMKVPGG